jgi:large subunit ribosomal protein L7/L12
MADLQQIAENLSSLSIMEASELVKMLETKWGVSAAAPVAVAAAGGAAPGAAKAEEKTEFTVVLATAGDKKINVTELKGSPRRHLGPGRIRDDSTESFQRAE